MKIGFTGTQVGMSEVQKLRLGVELYNLGPEEFHHGDCIGADEEAVKIARELGIKIVMHPPTNESKRAWTYQTGDQVWAAAPYLDRNKEIVRATDRLIAAPKTNKEEIRSGTWSTVRYAWAMGKNVLLLRR